MKMKSSGTLANESESFFLLATRTCQFREMTAQKPAVFSLLGGADGCHGRLGGNQKWGKEKRSAPGDTDLME